MYPKNAASPQRISIGAVVQISDGAVQTSGVLVKVVPQGGAAGASGGTVAYEEGIVHYVPTQAETNYTSFMLIAYKTGCIPVAVTIVTTASGVAGYAGLDWATINAPTTTVGLTNTTVGTVTTLTNLPAITAGWITAAGITAAALNGKGDWNIGKTGYSLTQTFPTNFSALSITAGGVAKADVDTIKTQAVTCGAGVTVLASVGTAATSTAQTGDSFARIGALGAGLTGITGVSLAADQAVNATKIGGAAVTATTSVTFPAACTVATTTGAVGSVTGAVGSVTGLTAANLDATVSSRMATYTQPTGFLAATFPASVASPTNITSATGVTLAATTGLGNQTANITGNLSGSVGSVTGLTAADVGAIKTKTDFLPSATAGAAGGVFIAGSNAATSVTTALTANITGNLSGSVGSVTAAVAITSNVKKNQALSRVEFLITDNTNHNPKTSAASIVATRSIDGGAFAAGTLSAVTEVSNGIYYVDFGAGDLNGNVITLRVTSTSNDDVFLTLITAP